MELFFITIAWIFGVIWGLYFKISIAFFVIPLIFTCMYLTIKKKIKVRKYVVLFLISVLISNIQITLLEKSFDEKYKNVGENLEIVGTIISNPIDKQYKNQYILKVEEINGNKKYKNTNLQLNVKKEKEDKYLNILATINNDATSIDIDNLEFLNNEFVSYSKLDEDTKKKLDDYIFKYYNSFKNLFDYGNH